jgi:hypothetical protein
LGIPWLGLIHDWSKFRPDEWFPYAFHFYGPDSHHGGGSHAPVRDETGYYKPTDTGDSVFDFAWLLHQKRNKHHWQWWVLPEDNGGLKTITMPIKYMKEMVADWRGAGRAQGKPDTLAWYAKNKDKIQLEWLCRSYVEFLIGWRRA